MSKLLFRSRWFALIWAIAVCFSIARFFGEGGGHEKLQVAAGQTHSEQSAGHSHNNPWGIDKNEREETSDTSGN